MIFAAALVAVTPTVSVTGYKLTSEGATQNLSTAVQAGQDGNFSLILVGTNVDELSSNSFSGNGLSNLSYNAATATLTGHGAGLLVITADSTTIANITIQAYGDDDDTNGQLP